MSTTIYINSQWFLNHQFPATHSNNNFRRVYHCSKPTRRTESRLRNLRLLLSRNWSLKMADNSTLERVAHWQLTLVEKRKSNPRQTILHWQSKTRFRRSMRRYFGTPKKATFRSEISAKTKFISITLSWQISVSRENLTTWAWSQSQKYASTFCYHKMSRIELRKKHIPHIYISIKSWLIFPQMK